MELLYTIDANAEVPIMLIDTHIGQSEEDGDGILGDKFSRELMFLDTLNKPLIQIWINSPGGVVTDGQQIFNTILKTKTKVDTHNVGMCASIALPIFLAGRNRYMMDNSIAMMHPVSGGDEQSRKVFEDVVNSMLSTRSFLTPEKIKQMMDATTWLNADDCKNLGLCEVEYSNTMNMPRKGSVKEVYETYKNVVNKLIDSKKTTIMKQVTNKLNLNEAANEAAIVEAITAIENKVADKTNELNELKAKLDKISENKKELEEKYNKLCNEMEEANKNKIAENKLAAENKAKDLITNAVKVGKIKNDAKIIETWNAQAIANFEATETILNSMTATIKAPIINVATDVNEKALSNVVINKMVEIQNKLNS